MTTWEETELWQKLKQRNDTDTELIRATIQSVIPDMATQNQVGASIYPGAFPGRSHCEGGPEKIVR